MDYVATDIVKSPAYSVRAKLIKSISLSDIGLIRESMIALLQVVFDKDMPLFWTR
jgi:hypothetical protein